MRRRFGRAARGVTGGLMVVLMVAVLPGIARADDSTTESTTESTAEETITVVPSVDTPEDDYGAGTDALIIGNGWAAGEEVAVVITGSDGVEYLSSSVFADESGHFELVFTLVPYFVPRYDVVANGPSGVATTSFTDVAVTLTNEATSAVDTVFFPGETVRAAATAVNVTNWYKFVIVQPDTNQAYVSAGCLTPAQATTGETYTLPAAAQVSHVQWAVRAVRYTDSACTLNQFTVATSFFAVTRSFAFTSSAARADCTIVLFQPATTGATGGCTDAVSQYAAGDSVFVRVLGYPKTDDVSTTWLDPSDNVECSNTGGTDRLNVGTNGVFDLQYVPVSPEVTDAACSPTSGADSGAWSLRLEPSITPPGAPANQTFDPIFSVGNNPPAATDDDASGTEDTLLTIAHATLLGNDSDGGDGGALSLTAVASPTGGTVVIDGSDVEFTPTANLCGSDVATFEYTVSDTFGTDTGLVTIDLTCVNDQPVAVDDDASGTEDTLLTIAHATLLGNDTDVDLDTLDVTAVASPTGGTVAIVGSNVEFTPTANLCGTDVATFEYTVSDGTLTDTGLVTIDLTCVNDPPVLTLPSTASGQYSDNLATVNLSATDVDNLGSELTFTNSATACGGTTGTLPAALSLTDNGDGTATITGQLTTKAGLYNSCIVVSDGALEDTGTIGITIQSEDATITPRSTNPAALQVGAGSVVAANALTLVFDVREKLPDLPAALAAAGDIDNAGLTAKLTPVAGGSSINLTCTRQADNGQTGYAEIETFSCKNAVTLPVNTYEVEVGIACVAAGCFYKGASWDAFTAYNPSAGFATGGGYIMLPTKNGPDEKVNFGFTMKYTKSLTNLKGNFIAIRHHADGTVSRLKSNSLGGLVINGGPPCGVATFNGKSTYTTWDPTANGGLGAYVTTGNNSFSVYAKDCNNPGTGLDYIWMFAPGTLNMSTTTGNAELDKVVLSGGNIAVPHRLR